jgi:hypothetical protein
VQVFILNQPKSDPNRISVAPTSQSYAMGHQGPRRGMGIHKNKLAKRTNRRIEKQRAINDYR